MGTVCIHAGRAPRPPHLALGEPCLHHSAHRERGRAGRFAAPEQRDATLNHGPRSCRVSNECILAISERPVLE
jgi:hypothetical protein